VSHILYCPLLKNVMLFEEIDGNKIAKKMVITKYLQNEFRYRKCVTRFPPYGFDVQDNIVLINLKYKKMNSSQIKT